MCELAALDESEIQATRKHWVAHKWDHLVRPLDALVEARKRGVVQGFTMRPTSVPESPPKPWQHLVAEVELSEGTELTVLQEWEGHYLAKDGDGKLFNVRKDLAEPA